MSEIPAGGLFNIGFQSDADAYRLRENYERIRIANNDSYRRMNAIATPPAGTEVTVARDYADSLTSRLVNATKGVHNKVLSGLLVKEQETPDMTLWVTAGDAIIDGVYCRKGLAREWTRSGTVLTITEPSHGLSIGSVVHIEATSDASVITVNPYAVQTVATNSFTIICNNAGATVGTCDFGRNSGTVTAPASGKQRLDVVCLNSDNTISVVTGAPETAGVWSIPAISSSQRPLAILKLLAATTSINDGVEILHDCRSKGCIVTRSDAPSAWFFAIQEAVDSIGENGTEIEVYPGNYYEEVDIETFGSFSLMFKKGATIYRPSATGRCIVADNSGAEFSVKIGGTVHLNANSMAGSVELMYLKNIAILDISGLVLDANSSSSASYKQIHLDTCLYGTLNVVYTPDIEGIGFTSCTRIKKLYKNLLGLNFSYLHSDSTTADAIFDWIKDQIPDNGDYVRVNGAIWYQTGPNDCYVLTCAYAVRTSSTNVDFFGLEQLNTNVLAVPSVQKNTYSMGDGVTSTTYRVSLAIGDE